MGFQKQLLQTSYHCKDGNFVYFQKVTTVTNTSFSLQMASLFETMNQVQMPFLQIKKYIYYEKIYNFVCPKGHRSRMITWLRQTNPQLSGAAFLQIIPFINLLTFVFYCVLCSDCSHGIARVLSSAILIVRNFFLNPNQTVLLASLYLSVPLPALPFRLRVIFCHNVFKEKKFACSLRFCLAKLNNQPLLAPVCKTNSPFP